jgi:signal transduction histidine kinase
MEKVFTRWPRHERPPSLDKPGDPVSLSPLSDFDEPHTSWRGPAGLAALAAIVTVLLAAGVALTAHLDGANTLLAVLAVASAAVAGASAYHAVRAGRATAESDARYLAVFERAGISMWREDWSVAAEEVMSLRQRGVMDMEGHFATRPDELRALCSRVMIRDVNAFTVEEAGAAGKHAFIGPLDRLLPHTDQTFVQWLVAFAQGERFFRSEAHITMPDGTVRDTLFAAALPTDLDGFRNIIVTSLDITGYKSQQAKLHAADAEIARASRISTVGALSASIAHEVNSPLAAVIANAQAALRWLRRPDPNVADATEAVSAIVAEATRAKDVVVRTRAFVGNAPCLGRAVRCRHGGA